MQTKSNTFKIVLTALMMCIIMVSILFIRIPIPFTQGYVHLGDAMIFLSVLILGWRYGAVAAALGGMLGDVIGGFAMWAPWTFAIKGIMALIVGLVIYAFRRKDGEQTSPKRKLAGEIVGMVLAGIFMTFGYYVAEGVMYGNWAAPLLGVPWNIGQFVVGLVIAIVIQKALERTALKEYFL